MPTPVEQIKEKIDIAELIGSYLKLQKAGVNYKALCPFHTEKTPSFYVTPSRQIWHCFGCSAGGDIFRFVMNIEGVEFPEALRILADKAGVALERQDPKLRSERTRLLELLETATAYYEKNLLERRDVGEYLKERGMTGETAKSFRLGYALNSWDEVFNHLKQKGFRAEEIERAGLAIKSEKEMGHYDRFRARIMFPIFDGAGRVVGFSGRIFSTEGALPAGRQGSASGGEKAVQEPAKYINTPQTILYDKSAVLYGFDKAKTEIRKKNSAVVLEGQMDLIMSHQAGVINAIAVSGTALTSRHIVALKRLCDTLIMSYDADSAGFEATKKSVDLAISAGLEVKIASIPGAKDPADLIKINPKDWTDTLGASKPVVAFLLESLREQHKDGLAFKKEVGLTVLPRIASIQSEILKAHWVGETAKALKVREEAVWQELERIKSPKKTFQEKPTPSVRNRKSLLEERVIGMVSWKKGDLGAVFADCKAEWFSAERRNIFESVLAGSAPEDHYVKKLALEAEIVYEGTPDFEFESKALLNDLRKEHLKEKLVKLGNAIRELESSGQSDELEKKFDEFRAVSAELTSA